jgi:hypothetical protein
MLRPNFVTEEDILRWDNMINNDPLMPVSLASSPTIREVCYAGLWLCDELEKLLCPDDIIVRLQHTAGRLSFGRNTWEVSSKLLEDYKNNNLTFENDPDAVQN